MKVEGKPAALVAITAALTMIMITHHPDRPVVPTASPQIHTQPVDNSLREMSLLRASRHRSVPVAKSQLKSNKLETPLVAARSRSATPKKHRVKQNLHVSVTPGAYAWAHSTNAIKVANCESGDRHSWATYNGNPHLRDGRYHGKWQMDPNFWASYGGLKVASDPADASESEQDVVAYRGYLARGWQPWSCARIMGII